MLLKKGEYKPRLHVFGLYSLVIKRLEKLPTTRSGIIRFPNAFEEICRSFQLPKKDCWELFLTLQDIGTIQIVRLQGIKIQRGEKYAR